MITSNNDSYRFRLGAFECVVVSDGTFAYPHPAQVFFVNAPEKELAEALQKYHLDPATWEQYISPYPSLVIDTGEHLVLVDTGAGGLAPTNGKLIPNLAKVGILPTDIDTVILTHGHPDHIGGNVDEQGNVVFPNARFVMWREEWEFWTGEPDLSTLRMDDTIKGLLLALPKKQLPPIEAQLDLIDAETEIVPGISAVAAPGHTPGHMALSISSQGEEMLNLVDTIIHPVSLARPDWYAAVDLLPEQTVDTRRRLLARAAQDQSLVFVFHFPLPSLGHILRDGEVWKWQPIEI